MQLSTPRVDVQAAMDQIKNEAGLALLLHSGLASSACSSPTRSISTLLHGQGLNTDFLSQQYSASEGVLSRSSAVSQCYSAWSARARRCRPKESPFSTPPAELRARDADGERIRGLDWSLKTAFTPFYGERTWHYRNSGNDILIFFPQLSKPSPKSATAAEIGDFCRLLKSPRSLGDLRNLGSWIAFKIPFTLSAKRDNRFPSKLDR
ncbi:hypothetical protein EMPG_17770 [Blastomyces silverae]|uniref:Uncharacterized protein n=1 Tax=Blastomyces silverae TaxID=2060906 RepID=A0A0H1B6N3_9EURO|nr:hypothetical protein EMPG_17770 [Blastomyces silverae]